MFWNSRNRLVRKADLFKTIRGEIRDRADAFALIRDMDRNARIYAALSSPEDVSWSKEERDSLSQLQMFNVRQPLALLLAAFERMSDDDRSDFARLLRAVAVVSFRYNVICGRQSNEQEREYNRIACALFYHQLDGAADTIREMRRVYPEDDEFRTAFADKELRTTSSRNKKVARFLLFRLERQLSQQDFDFESSKYDIEHVLPEHPDGHWDQFDERKRDSSTYRLGNLTLLSGGRNRDVGNAGFTQKRSAYAESQFAITRRLAEEYDSWTVDKIRSRQSWMAKQATSVWRVDL